MLADKLADGFEARLGVGGPRERQIEPDTIAERLADREQRSGRQTDTARQRIATCGNGVESRRSFDPAHETARRVGRFASRREILVLQPKAVIHPRLQLYP